jgi:hypothetical protein
MPFGQFAMIAGGSLFQVIVPAVFAGYLLSISRKYGESELPAVGF